MTLPSYQQYGAPQQRSSRPWLWALVGALIGAAVTAVAGVAILIGIGIWMLGGDYVVTDAEVTEATQGPCEDLNVAARELSRFSGTTDGAAALIGVGDSLDGLAETIGATGTSDGASLAWQRDLENLSARVAGYADDVAAGDLTPPDLGASTGLIERIDLGAPAGCEIPPALSSLDPDYRGYWG